MDRPGKTPQENTDAKQATVRGVIIPDNNEARLAQLQQALNLFRSGLQLISEALNTMGQIIPPEPDP